MDWDMMWWPSYVHRCKAKDISKQDIWQYVWYFTHFVTLWILHHKYIISWLFQCVLRQLFHVSETHQRAAAARFPGLWDHPDQQEKFSASVEDKMEGGQGWDPLRSPGWGPLSAVDGQEGMYFDSSLAFSVFLCLYQFIEVEILSSLVYHCLLLFVCSWYLQFEVWLWSFGSCCHFRIQLFTQGKE